MEINRLILLLFLLLRSVSTITAVVSFTTNLDADKRYLVVRIHRLGLANRLRCIADWHQIAVRSDRHLLVSWAPTYDCNITFPGLFIAGPAGFSIMQRPLGEGQQGIEEVTKASAASALSFQYLDLEDRIYWQSADRFIIRSEVLNSKTMVLMTDYDGVISQEGIPCQQYLYSRAAFLSSLVPNAEDAETVRGIRDTYFRSSLVVGVHIRTHDTMQDWEVVPPFDASSNSARKFGEGAGIEDFDRIMTSIRDKFTEGNGSDKQSAVKFFIASNSDEVKLYFSTKYKDSLSLRGGDYNRNSAEGIHFAFLEWLLLSESALIINTYGSSFAVEAAQRYLRPIVGVWGGRAIFHSDIRLELCGHMQYMKAISTHVSKYTEGTVDKREVNAKMVPLRICPVMAEWGLGEIYCSLRERGRIETALE